MSSITAGTTSTTTLVHSGDTTGSLVFKTNDTGSGGTTAVTIDTSQRAAFVAGTAALPAITTSGDTNTGIYFPAADTIAFAEGGAEAMRIDSSGNVGIGTSSPAVRLNVTDSSDGGNSGTIRLGSDGTYYGQQQFRYNSSEYRFGVYPSGNMTFYTKGSESMRIDSSGNLLVGLTANSYNSKLTVQSDASAVTPFSINDTSTGSTSRFIATWYRGGSSVGNISITNTTTAYNTSSDYRLKENIAPMTGALAKVAQLKPVTYKWKVDGSDGEGFIAHELAEVKPDCVSGEKDAVDADGNPVYQGIDTSFLVATLTAAIQELKAINDQQAETINALTARVVALEGQ